jgi:hypothetical protein
MRGSRTAQVRAQVNALRVRELQAVLADMNLSRSGRKQELIDRIVAALEVRPAYLLVLWWGFSPHAGAFPHPCSN